jgi:putative transposase
MKNRRNCWNNAPMERYFISLKTERIPMIRNKNFNEAKQAIINYIMDYYNQTKLYRYNGGLNPNKSERIYELNYKTMANITDHLIL